MQAIFELVIFDLDGVVYLGEEAIPGAPEAIAQLKSAGVRVCYLTNSSGSSRPEYVEKLGRLGIPTPLEDIYTSGYLTALYLQGLKHLGKRVLLIGEAGFGWELEQVGLELVEEPPADFVAIGIDYGFSYQRLDLAWRCFEQGALLVASNKDRTYPSYTGVHAGGGSISAAIEYACDAHARVVGKPAAHSVRLIMQAVGASSEHTLLVGDRLDTDIAAACNARIASALVLTGISSRAEGEAAVEHQRPGWILESIRDVPELVLSVEAQS